MTNPRYFGLFNPGPNFPSQCADRIASAFNPQLASSASSPVPVALESHVIRAVARRAGFGAEATGHFATGGSEANYTALICALTAAHPALRARGCARLPGRPRCSTPRANATSRGSRSRTRRESGAALCASSTPTARGAWIPRRSRDAIAADRAAGAVPVMIVATAGTTGGGMIDPLHACADIAPREELWYHVDAAWGGAALASDRLRGLLAGIERADSITIDAHKWLATTMGCAIVHHDARRRCSPRPFTPRTSFMPSSVARRRPLPQQRAVVAPLPRAAPVSVAGGGRLDRARRARRAQRRGHRTTCASGWSRSAGRSPTIRRSRCSMCCRPEPATCAPWYAGWSTSGRAWVAPTTCSRVATW